MQMKKIWISFAEGVEPDFVSKTEIRFSGCRLTSLLLADLKWVQILAREELFQDFWNEYSTLIVICQCEDETVGKGLTTTLMNWGLENAIASTKYPLIIIHLFICPACLLVNPVTLP